MITPIMYYDATILPDISHLQNDFEFYESTERPLERKKINKFIQFAFREQLSKLEYRKKIASQLDPIKEETILELQKFINDNNTKIEKLTLKPNAFIKEMEILQEKENAQNELNELVPYQAYKKAEAKIIENKENVLKDYMASLKTEDCVLLALKALNTSLACSPILNNIIHPAARVLSLENVTHPTTKYQTYHQKMMYEIENDIQKGLVDRLQIMTHDHQLLDGIVIYSDPKQKNKPVMIMSQGNLSSYETAYNISQAYAKQFKCNIVLYNSRGVGHSLGKGTTTNDLVNDCKAVIKYTLAKFCEGDSAKLAVYGHSLGGGITAQALKEMVKVNDLPPLGVGLYINHCSFSSLHGFVAGISDLPLEGISKALLKTLGHNPLNTAKAMHHYVLAKQSVIVTTVNDELMKGRGKLSAKIQTTPRINQLTFNSLYVTHNEEMLFAMSLTSAFEKLDDKTDKSPLKQYQCAILNWIVENGRQTL